jgi:hypothetical protein
LQRDIAHPHRGHGAHVGGDEQIDLEARVGHAQVYLIPLAHQPPVALVAWHVGVLERDDDASAREVRRPDAAVHVPHQQSNIQVLGAQLAAHPAGTPFAHRPDQRREFPPGIGQVILVAATQACGAPFDHAFLLQEFEALREQC